MDGEVLERVYKENLEERIISYLAERKNTSLENAMDLYYNSTLSDQIFEGLEGIQYLDYKVLADILLEKEEKIKV